MRLTLFDGGIMSYSHGEVDVEVRDMRAQHIYSSVFVVSDGSFAISVIDEGDNVDFRQQRQLRGVNTTCGDIEF
ncbi:MAG: hypothetical protein QNI98_04465 [Woeseiaceae bacterium]|nr:hypothetical protein [Woeseiaceae bacterium]